MSLGSGTQTWFGAQRPLVGIVRHSWPACRGGHTLTRRRAAVVELVAAATCRRTLQPATPLETISRWNPWRALAHPRAMKPRRRTPMVAMSAVSAGALALLGGCANPRGTANALSPVQPVSSAALTPGPSSPVPSSSAPTSPAASTEEASHAPASSSASASTDVRDSTQIYGAVTAASERELVMTYLGGDCDVSARGKAAENSSTITVHLLVTSSNGMCSAVGYVRTVVGAALCALG